MNNRDKTILIVDDTIVNLDILSELLYEYDVVEATNGEEALSIVNEDKIDLILLDIMMPNMDGFEVCQKLKENPQTKDIPIIFITAKIDEASIVKAYDIGGADYVTKPFLPKELLARVKKELQIQDMISELKFLASTDPMTKLYNRRYFSTISEHTLDLVKREKKDLSIIMLDIDKFKKINDTHGHHIGDKVIMHLANKIIICKRKSDISARFGGEEFVILLPNTNINGAKIVAETLRKSVENAHLVYDINNNTLNYTVSLGVSQINLSKNQNIQDGLEQADEALYLAKKTGRNKTISTH